MRNTRAWILIAATLTACSALSAAQPQEERQPSGDAPAVVAVKPPEENPFPLVVRIDKAALSRFVDNEYDERRPVTQCVLGAYVVGQSHTLGTSRAELRSDAVEAAFDVRFTGTTESKTVGTQEPGVVYSRTYTTFVCTQRVVFDPRRGFVKAGEPTIQGDTELVYDGFGSTRRLGERLIRRLTERRSHQLFEPARRIADRDNKRDTLDGFEQEVDKTLRAANDGLHLVRYVDRFLGTEAQLQLHAKSSPDCIQLEIGPQGERFAPMTELPAGSGAPIEVWAHYSLLGAPVLKLIDLAAATDKLPSPLRDKFEQALSLSPSSEDDGTDFEFRDGWLVLGFPIDVVAATPPSDVIRQAAKPK